MEGATKLKCSEFGDAIISNMDSHGVRKEHPPKWHETRSP